MTYIPLIERKILEEDGNLSLYADPQKNSLVFTQIKGNEYYFSLHDNDLDVTLELDSKGMWFGIPHAAEKEGDIIKLILRRQFANIPGVDPVGNNFTILNFELVNEDLVYTGPESAATPRDDENNNLTGKNNFFPLFYKSDKKRLKQLNVDLFSDLEEWVFNNEELKTEYGETGINGSGVHEGNYNKNGYLEEWAYYKYQELYPGKPMLEGFGVREEKKINDGDNFNQDKIYIPSKFNKKSVEKITSFNPSTDTLKIDTDSFGINDSATFAAGKSKKAVKKRLAKQDFDFLYDEKKGGLYFNENGSDKGFGEGGIIAILKGAPDLTSNDLEFI